MFKVNLGICVSSVIHSALLGFAELRRISRSVPATIRWQKSHLGKKNNSSWDGGGVDFQETFSGGIKSKRSLTHSTIVSIVCLFLTQNIWEMLISSLITSNPTDRLTLKGERSSKFVSFSVVWLP